MEKKKRLTPIDDPSITEKWKEKHRSNTEELQLSNRQSYYNIAKEYNCSWTTVRYWVDKRDRERSIKHRKDNYVPYAKLNSKRLNYKKIHSHTYTDIRRRPDIYLEEVLKNVKEPLSLDDITLKLSELTGIEFRNKTFLNVVRKYEGKIGVKIFEEVPDTEPPQYRLV